ncbi:MAG: phosphoadenylyl-sulfate reductase [Methanobacterium paludis]|nr:phosphoadenylyl-sulfate reductase [Methanobacterium paludis]
MIEDIRKKLEGKNLIDSLSILSEHFNGKVIFTTSFGLEDQVVTDLIFANKIPIRVVTLDTGRLFEETYKTYSQTLDKYHQSIEVFAPEAGEVENLLTAKGPFSFYASIENRKECCHIRKVHPLMRALKGMECWVTGIRADQSTGRQHMHAVEWDEVHEMVKFNPLFDWTYNQVREYIDKNHIPYNILHDRGFVSIGCAPCTRAIREGEDFRAGRWWWEENSGKECGLHVKE